MSGPMTVVNLAKPFKDHGFHHGRVSSKNGELRQRLYNMKGSAREMKIHAGTSEKAHNATTEASGQLWSHVAFVTEEGDGLDAKCEELISESQCL